MSSSMESAAVGATIDTGSEPDREIGRFLDFIGDRRISERGGVVFNRMAGSFAKLQQECAAGLLPLYFPSTVRYRFNSGCVFGTLFAALISDLLQIAHGEMKASLTGAFEPNFTNAIWHQWFQMFGKEMHGWQALGEGILDRDLFDIFYQHLLLPLAQNAHLIIFAEVYGSDGDEHAMEEWRKAQEFFFQRLPGRLTFVLSGVPEGFNIPTGPDFLEISLVDEEERVTTKASRFIAAPILTDRPTTDDTLGIQDYARALARFILHSETRPPLTIGIHGPW
ncbi:MAG: hypothetical protein ABIR47_14630, partial [Candidatus Kapaibacterium sp.]